MDTVLITGGTGMIGRALTAFLVQKGYKVIVLSRRKKEASSGISYALWDVPAGTIDAEAVRQADHIVHLAGANVADKRWTADRKQEIVESRVQSGALLVKALREIPNKVKTVISASAIGWYGPDPQVPNPHPFTEDAPADPGFLGATCQQWEEAIAPVTSLSKRLLTLRIGIVLSNEGGAYAEFVKPLRFGVASVLGPGTQVVSWIHIDDLVQLIVFGIQQPQLAGTYNAVAPHPVNNRQLIETIARTKGGFHITAPVPSFVLKAMLGEMSIEVLKSATVSARKVQAAGFAFAYPDIDKAVKALHKKAS